MNQNLPGKNLFAYLADTVEFKSLQTAWEQGKRAQAVFGVVASLRTLLLATLVRQSGRPLLIVTYAPEQARKIIADLRVLLSAEEVLYFPPAEVMFYEVLSTSSELLGRRLAVLSRLACREPVVVVTTVEALQKNTVPPEVIRAGMVSFATGHSCDLAGVIEELTRIGYKRQPLVEAPGQFSVRGGLLDVFAVAEEQPARIEFFGDEVDLIRLFDPETQRSRDAASGYVVGPARELLLSPPVWQAGRQRFDQAVQAISKKWRQAHRQEAVDHLQAKAAEYLELMSQGIWVDGMEQFQNFFYPDQSTLFDYLHPEALVCWDEPARIKKAATARDQANDTSFIQLLEDGLVLPEQREIFGSYNGLLTGLREKPVLFLSLLPKKLQWAGVENTVQFSAKPMHPYLGKLDLLAEELNLWRRQRASVLILAAKPARRERIVEVLRDYGVEANLVSGPNTKLVPGMVQVGTGHLEAGFELTRPRVVVITDFEIFGREKKPRRPRKVFREGAKIDSFLDLAVGDYVVHVNHGIGRYLGVEKISVDGVGKDYLVIKYSGEDRLYVPTDQVQLVQKYVGAEGAAPKVYRLGGSEWQKVKQRVKESVRDMAVELLQLYATRQSRPGFTFSPDTPWQKEMEDIFPYEETPDQLRSIKEVKRDMENAQPMDRLLCGDVGYGKTEVAIRAAFKAVQDGKQVAVMVPTTILAQQHYNTFRERFGSYPMTVAMLSRFCSAKEQKSIGEGLASGLVDVVIGTHRLISPDIKFRELGLLIIDEEQRFGVAHKERIKQLKQSVDVLTLSATPIPRTLHMAMVGLRDMSVIDTPPEDRYPVQTYVVEYNPALIRDAIHRELHRGGQVYYVRNRIEDLDRIARELGKMVPEARIAIGHGKMREDHLEQVMMDFLVREYDILVCTTIIETGLDIPNVNTLIVDGADLLGLAQLYQLRGRVGRSNRIAYAYFTYRKDKILTEVAEKRLYAIREFTELGSGFKIAMRDLEIRGAGNLLGPEQHGQMAAVGFDLYCRLLEEAVRELQGEKPAPELEITVEIQVDAFIPDDYIADPGLKVQFYKRLLVAKTPDQVEALEEELLDCYGDQPGPVRNLIRLSRLKAYGQQCGLALVQREKDLVRLRFHPAGNVAAPGLAALVQFLGRRVHFSAAGNFEIRIRVDRLSTGEIMTLLVQALKILAEHGAKGPAGEAETTAGKKINE
ncbi:MAG: transcription-repair coupling factor [Heliobacteriaceae bacterium]|nr:transcription-repair coupling factor [Heliobacteriaceae bacterium]MDD4587645.1 transcription-repair coupling factor [Heliobacteriaceae bacterium]